MRTTPRILDQISAEKTKVGERPCQVKQLLREIRPAVMVGNPGDPCTGCNRSWYPKRKLDNACSPPPAPSLYRTWPAAGGLRRAYPQMCTFRLPENITARQSASQLCHTFICATSSPKVEFLQTRDFTQLRQPIVSHLCTRKV